MRFREFIINEAVSDPAIVKQQEKLRDLGYNLGSYGPKGDGVDGLMGPYTKAALDAYAKGIDPKNAPSPEKQDVEKFNHDTGFSGSKDRPTKGPITGEYGRMVRSPQGGIVPHPGVDIGAPEGSPVLAPDSGKIITAVRSSTAGNLVELITDTGEKHRFMHLSKMLVGRGDVVKKGDTIGLVGSTGFSTGPHLHWEKYASNGQQVNPIA